MAPIFALGYELQNFDNPDRTDFGYLELKSRIFIIVYYTLGFPIITALLYLFPYSKNWFNWFPLIPYILNSLLWSSGFYFLINKFYKDRFIKN